LEKKVYTTKDIASSCGVTTTTIYQWIHRGKIADVEIKDTFGKRIWTQADMDRFMEYAKSRKVRKAK